MEKVKREKMQVREKEETSRNTVFSDVLWLRRVASRPAKAAGAEAAGQMKHNKLHAALARSTFGSKKCQNTSAPDDFWKLRC